jgi:poly-gamma-glutamate capsule biosynthesis protein CapA/YwtB (metallophosphatase superfamily)
MLILFDQGTPVPLRKFLPGHQVRTAAQQRWSTLLNGELLRAAEQAGFDVLPTTDTHLQFQQNVQVFKLAVVVLNRNRWQLIQTVIPPILAAIAEAKPGSITVVDIPLR